MNDFKFLANLSSVTPQRQWEELKPLDFILDETEIAQMRKAYIFMISKVAARFIPTLSFMSEVLPTQMKGVHSKFLTGKNCLMVLFNDLHLIRPQLGTAIKVWGI